MCETVETAQRVVCRVFWMGTSKCDPRDWQHSGSRGVREAGSLLVEEDGIYRHSP